MNRTDDPMVTNNSYLDVFLALLLSTTVLPVPEELPVITAGVLCGHSDTKYADDRDHTDRVRWWIMLPVVILGAVLGDIVLYAIGRWKGPWLLSRKWVERRLISAKQRTEIEQKFDKYGVAVLLGVRLLPGIRGWVFVIAGMVRLPLWKFVLADAIYAIPIVNLMFWLAYWFTDQIMVLVHQVDAHKSLVMSHLLAAVAGAFIYRYMIARHIPTGEPPHVPAIISKPAGAIGHVVESAFETVTGRHHHEKHGEDGQPHPGSEAEPKSPTVVPPG
jgi:membrane protein DedA with SNARE-associated domain